MPLNESFLPTVSNWFHAKKVKPIQAKKLTEPIKIDTLEGEVEATQEDVDAGCMLCKGAAEEFWIQKRSEVFRKYISGELFGEWQVFYPNPDAVGVMAAQVDHQFQVEASWGLLSGKPGDFVLKNFADKDVEVPDDVWIVDKNVFEATYEAVE